MFKVFIDAYDMAIFTILYEQGFLSGILKICRLISGLLFAIAITKKLINIFKGEGNTNYKSLLIRLFVTALILSLFPQFYIGAIRLNDTLLLSASDAMQEKKTFWNAITTSFKAVTIDSIREYKTKKYAIFNDDFIERGFTENEYEEKETKWYEHLINTLGAILNFDKIIGNLTVDKLIASIVVFLANTLIYFFSIIRSVLFSLYLLLGPFVATLYIEDSTSDFFKGYILSFLNVLFWPWIQFVILICTDVAITTANYTSGTETIKVCAAYLALLYLLYKSTSFIPDMRRGRGGADSGLVISSVMNTGLRAASRGAKAAIGTAFPQVAPFLNSQGTGEMFGKAIGSMFGATQNVINNSQKGVRR